MSSLGSISSSRVTSFFLIFFSLVFLFFPNTALAVTTEEHFGYQVYASNNPWRNPDATAGGVDGRYGTCDVDSPSLSTVFGTGSNCIIIWNFRGFPEIPVGSTINKLIVKTYANTSGNSGQFRIGFEGGECDISDFNWQNNITSYLIPTGKCGYDLYTHADIRRDFSISNHYVSGKPNHINLDAISIHVDYTPPQPPTPTATATPTTTPTPTPTPTPAGPEPFLDLPWDYEGKGLSFSEAALNINSFFDHEYPLQSRGLDLKEPLEAKDTTVNFFGFPRKDIDHNGIWYSSHDGYDYGTRAGVHDGDSVYPAAPGIAEYKKDPAGGETIFIDHKNGYQTRYYHLQDTGLITNQPGVKVEVNRDTVIGRVGATGSHVDGAHIHIGVFEDKNYDEDSNNNFVNYEPHGATDPFGWQPYMEESERDPDPWENYSFFYSGKQRTGSKSYYLWKEKLPGVKDVVTSSGGTYTAGKVKVEVQPDTFINPVTLSANYAPSAKLNGSVWSVGPVIEITAKNLAGDFITLLNRQVTLIWFPFRDTDLSRFKVGSFYLYSSKDGNKWTKETEVNPFNPGEIKAAASHFTYFAIMGERKDMMPPVTSVQLNGAKGQDNWFRSDVEMVFSVTDSADEDPAGVDYSLYKIEGEDWKTYNDPLVFTEEGHQKVSFYSVDKDGNIENVKTIGFDIDKTSPDVSAIPDRAPDANDWYSAPVTITFAGQDSSSGIETCSAPVVYIQPDKINAITEGSCIDKAGNTGSASYKLNYDAKAPTLTANAFSKGDSYSSDSWTNTDVKVEFNCTDETSGVGTVSDPITISKEGKDQSVKGECVDNAGNKSEIAFNGINIDKTSPEAEIRYDLSTFDSRVTGKDNLGSTTVTIDKTKPLQPEYTISDQAGNSLLLSTGKIKMDKQVALNIKSLQYNGDSSISLDPNIFFTLALTNKTNLKQLDQYFSIKNDKKIFSNYLSSTNITKIYTRTPGSLSYTKEEKSGVVLLQLFTEKGSLKFRY